VTFHDNYARLGDLMGQDLTVSPGNCSCSRVTPCKGFMHWWADRIPDSAFNHEDRIRRLVSGGELGLDQTRKLAALARANLPQDDIA
jgi:predicted chitinase